MKLRYHLLALCLMSTTVMAETKPASPQEKELTAILKSVKPVQTPFTQAATQQVTPCWAAPQDAVGDSGPVVVLAELDRNGRFTNLTIPKSEGPKYHTDITYRAIANAAMAAMMKCQPIKGLPADKYEGWKSMALTFDPKSMPVTPPQESLAPQGAAPAGSEPNPFLGNAPAGGGGAAGVIPADQIH